MLTLAKLIELAESRHNPTVTMSRPRLTNSLRGTAERLSVELGVNVSIKSVRIWKAKGYPIDDISALRKCLGNQERSPLKSHSEAAAAQTPPPSPVTPNAAAIDHGDIELSLKQLQRKLLESDDYATARTIRIQIAGVRDVLRALQDQSFFVTKESQIRDGMATGEAIKALVLKIPSDLPQMIIGLDYPDAVARCEDYAYQILTSLAEAREGNET